MDEVLSDLPISATSAWVLVKLNSMGAGIRQTDLAALLDITSASLVRLIDELAEEGFAERAPDATDRRVKRVSVTPAGLEIVKIVERQASDLRRRSFSSFDDATLSAAIELLDALDLAFQD